MRTLPINLSILQLLQRGTPEFPEPYRDAMLRHTFYEFQTQKVLASMTMMAISAVVVFVVSAHELGWLAWLWFAPIAIYSSKMIHSGRRKVDRSTTLIPTGRFVRRAETGAFFLALWWNGIVLLPIATSPSTDLMLVGLCAGMCAGTVFMSSTPGVAVRYVVGALLILAIDLINYQSVQAVGCTICAFPLGIALIVMARNYYRSKAELVLSHVQSEQMLSTLNESLDAAYCGFAIYSPKGDLIASNDAHKEHFGSLSFKELSAGTSTVTVRGRFHFVRSISTTFTGNRVVTHTDITEQRQAQVAIRRAEEEMIRMLEERAEFLSRASAELIDPVKFIKSLATVMGQDSDIAFPLEERVKLCSAIDDVAEQLIDRVNDIARYAGDDVLDLEIKADTEDLVGFLEPDEVKRWPGLNPAAAAKLSVRLPEGPIMVSTDITVLQENVTALVNRAWKKTERPVNVILMQDNTGDITIAVIEHSTPISLQAAQSIFEPFVDETSNRDELYSKRGLELALIKQSTERNGLSISCQPLSGIGTAFLITIPGSKIMSKPETMQPKNSPLQQIVAA